MCVRRTRFKKIFRVNGHTLVVTSDKDAKGCKADKELVDADIVISQPFGLII